jgi:hypothetical protein
MRRLAKEILTFLVLVFLFSSVPYALMIHSHHIGSGGGLVVRLVMWCPTFAALATCALRHIDPNTLAWNWRPAKYEAYGYLLPLIYAIPVYAVTWIAIKGSFSRHLATSRQRSYAMKSAAFCYLFFLVTFTHRIAP